MALKKYSGNEAIRYREYQVGSGIHMRWAIIWSCPTIDESQSVGYTKRANKPGFSYLARGSYLGWGVYQKLSSGRKSTASYARHRCRNSLYSTPVS